MKRVLMLFGLMMAGLVILQAQETKRPAFYANASWSPDGSKILFESTRDGKYNLFTIRPDGSDLRKLSTGETNDEQPRWSGDGRQIVFISDRDGHLQLYLMNADGSQQRRLTTSEDVDYQPDFSFKGDQVAFVSRPNQPIANHDIYIIRTGGTQRKRLTDQTGDCGSPRWSPDGKTILFVRGMLLKKSRRDMSKEEVDQMRSSQDIFRMNADGSNLKNLTNNNVRDSTPVWAADGKTIYFSSDRDGAPYVYTMDPDGSNVRKIADANTVSAPNISPDGKYFTYAKQVNGKTGVYSFDLKSGQERLLIGG